MGLRQFRRTWQLGEQFRHLVLVSLLVDQVQDDAQRLGGLFGREAGGRHNLIDQLLHLVFRCSIACRTSL